MPLKTIFNRFTHYKPFVIDSAEFSDDEEPVIEVTMRARSNGKPRCSVCHKPSTCYDTLPTRRFSFIPLWMIPVVLIYARRRVNCQQCGVKVEWIPWATGKNRLTTEYQWFLAGSAKRMSWKEVAFINSDMLQAYIKVIAKKASQAIHVLDRFHVVKKMGKAIDKVRAAEAKQFKVDGYEEVLKGGRWLLLKRPENLGDKQAVKLSQLLEYNLKSMRSYLMKEDFQQFWNYRYPANAGKFLDAWCFRAMRSKIEPIREHVLLEQRLGH